MRIISVVPSLTELLFDLGLQDQIVGVTRFCVHPKEELKGITKLGGTKTLKLDRIKSLDPDIIIANKEENSKTDIETLQKEFNVLLTDIFTINDAYEAIKEIGKQTNTQENAISLVNKIAGEFNKISKPDKPKRIAYLIWNDPIMLSGRNTFINNLIEQIGHVNVLNDLTSRYPQVTDDELLKLEADYLFLSSEPFPFKEKHKLEFQKRFPNIKVVLVDGEMFSWYGSRLKIAPDYFNTLLNSLD